MESGFFEISFHGKSFNSPVWYSIALEKFTEIDDLEQKCRTNFQILNSNFRYLEF